MVSIFNDETENGMLYIDYPMVEAIRDQKFIGENEYINKMVNFADFSKYKILVEKRGYQKRIDSLDFPDLKTLIRQTVEKIETLFAEKIVKYCDYRKYPQKLILEKQIEIFKKSKNVMVFASLCLLPIDYFGEKFFRSVIKSD